MITTQQFKDMVIGSHFYIVWLGDRPLSLDWSKSIYTVTFISCQFSVGEDCKVLTADGEIYTYPRKAGGLRHAFLTEEAAVAFMNQYIQSLVSREVAKCEKRIVKLRGRWEGYCIGLNGVKTRLADLPRGDGNDTLR